MKDGNIVQIGTPEEILMNPSNQYVERFVEDVDLSKVLTAHHVMKRAETVQIEKGPRVALQLMRELGISSIYAVDKQQKLLGVVSAADAKKAVEIQQSLPQIITTDLSTVSPETLLTDLFDKVSEATIPVAVIDDQKRLKGILIKGAVIGALAGNEKHINVWNEKQDVNNDIPKVVIK
jgi:glycine betaine/proline transport system ATP-binding protein